jgi:hypothetical protein
LFGRLPPITPAAVVVATAAAAAQMDLFVVEWTPVFGKMYNFIILCSLGNHKCSHLWWLSL